MKKIFFLISLFSFLSSNAWAEEAKENGFRVNFRRVALDLSSTEVKNADQYQGSSVSALSSDSETVVKGVFDGVLEYEQENYQWNNSLYMAYGKKTLKPYDKPRSTNKNADQILLTTDYAEKVWKYGEADVGPFGNLGYETQFTDNDNGEKTKILRAKSGIKLWNGEYIKELYGAMVGEHDMTYDKDVDKLAWEIGTRAEYPIRDGVKLQFEGYFRDYLAYSEYVGEDLKYDLNLVGRMDVKLNETISLAPFLSYRMAQSREASKTGSNFMIGVSLAYADLFNL